MNCGTKMEGPSRTTFISKMPKIMVSRNLGQLNGLVGYLLIITLFLRADVSSEAFFKLLFLIGRQQLIDEEGLFNLSISGELAGRWVDKFIVLEVSHRIFSPEGL